jgi:hypothetical protein
VNTDCTFIYPNFASCIWNLPIIPSPFLFHAILIGSDHRAADNKICLNLVMDLAKADMLPRIGRGSRSFARSFATHVSQIEKDCASITPPYALLIQRINEVRKVLKRPLTLAEKILYSHLINPKATLSDGGRIRGEAYLQLRPERVAMQDASAQYVVLSVSIPILIKMQDGIVRILISFSHA